MQSVCKREKSPFLSLWIPSGQMNNFIQGWQVAVFHWLQGSFLRTVPVTGVAVWSLLPYHRAFNCWNKGGKGLTPSGVRLSKPKGIMTLNVSEFERSNDDFYWVAGQPGLRWEDWVEALGHFTIELEGPWPVIYKLCDWSRSRDGPSSFYMAG